MYKIIERALQGGSGVDDVDADDDLIIIMLFMMMILMLMMVMMVMMRMMMMITVEVARRTGRGREKPNLEDRIEASILTCLLD